MTARRESRSHRASLVCGTQVFSLPKPQDMLVYDIIVIYYLKNNLKKPGQPMCFEIEFVILSIRAWCAVGRSASGARWDFLGMFS